VFVKDRRYVVCLNEEQRRRDAADREAIVAQLRERLPAGGKEFVGNKGTGTSCAKSRPLTSC